MIVRINNGGKIFCQTQGDIIIKMDNQFFFRRDIVVKRRFGNTASITDILYFYRIVALLVKKGQCSPANGFPIHSCFLPTHSDFILSKYSATGKKTQEYNAKQAKATKNDFNFQTN